jgi:hypothetical protein
VESCDALEAVTPVVEELQRLGVRYYICGSFASVFYGIPRSTVDVDLVADLLPKHVASFVESLRDKYYVDERMILDAIARKSCFNAIYLPTNFKVDVFVAKNRPYDRESMARIHQDSLDDDLPSACLFLPSPEDVVLSKLEWFRLGDEVSERQWRDVVGVLKIRRDSLDRSYLDKWAAELHVADLLAKAWKEVETSDL